MKKFVLSFALAASLVAPQAHAFGILTGFRYVGTPSSDADWAATFLCVALLPLCVLDEKTEAYSWSKQDLIDNGYSEARVEAIVSGQNALAAHMAANNSAITKEGSMSKAEVVNFISTVKGVTPEYVQFVNENM